MQQHSSAKKLAVKLINHRPFRHLFIFLVILAFLLGIIIVPFEIVHPEATIQNVGDGLWWAAITVTGVGYGDFFPVTVVGKLIGSILAISGVMMFGLMIGIIGVTMTKKQEEFYWMRLFDRLDDLDKRIENIEKTNIFLVKDNHENRNQPEQIEEKV
jgi:voltage-gated potassium channel